MICDFCYRHCELPLGGVGACHVRHNINGTISHISYGKLVALAVDPVEKKPLYHFLPGTQTVSLAMAGCNLACKFCQNWHISQSGVSNKEQPADPKAVVDYCASQGYPSISFTYSEPLVWQDYMLEVAKAAHDKGIRTIMVSNGTFSCESLTRILPHIDAYNIDVKGDERFYQRLCHGSLSPVVSSLEELVDWGAHVEVTTMVMQGEHDGPMLQSLGNMLHAIGIQVWHLGRFFPNYLMQDHPPTSELFLSQMMEVAKATGVPHVYPGNSALQTTTSCSSCRTILGKDISHGGICPHCEVPVYGVWY